jgi:hypothetical protein
MTSHLDRKGKRKLIPEEPDFMFLSETKKASSSRTTAKQQVIILDSPSNWSKFDDKCIYIDHTSNIDESMPCSSKPTQQQIKHAVYIIEDDDELYDPCVEIYDCDKSNKSNSLEPYLEIYQTKHFKDELQYVGTVQREAQYECGCCFAEYDFSSMTQCEQGHLFCSECAKRGAQSVIGHRKIDIMCLCSTEKCDYKFADSEIQRFLPQREFEAYIQLCQEINITKAGLEGFESCPFCPFGMLLPPEHTALTFTCEREGCRVVSCRKCKKKNHAPALCDSMVEDAVHSVAEAMTNALIRTCYACKNKFFKTEGCNKMTCSCGAKMCYVCRQPVKDYNHFVNKETPGRCMLWDNTVQRNIDEAVRAGNETMKNLGVGAQEQLQKLGVGKLVDTSLFPTVQAVPGQPGLAAPAPAPPVINAADQAAINLLMQEINVIHTRHAAERQAAVIQNDALQRPLVQLLRSRSKENLARRPQIQAQLNVLHQELVGIRQRFMHLPPADAQMVDALNRRILALQRRPMPPPFVPRVAQPPPPVRVPVVVNRPAPVARPIAALPKRRSARIVAPAAPNAVPVPVNQGPRAPYQRKAAVKPQQAPTVPVAGP